MPPPQPGRHRDGPGEPGDLPGAGRGQRQLADGRRGAAADARGLPARGSRPDRHAPRLRARLLRQLQRALRRADGARVPDARRAGRRPFGRERRGPRGARRDAQRAPAGVHRAPWPAMRVLHPGDADDRGRVHALPSRGRERRRDPRGDQRRHLSLHGLPADRRGDPGRIRRLAMIIEQDPNAAKVALDTKGAEGVARRWLGKSINRVEDPRFLRGEGRYIDDIKLPGMAHAAIVRSPHAHAKILAIRTEAAEQLPGVIAVVTGKDVAERANPLPSFGAGPIIQEMIAIEKVRPFGECVAAVIAESRSIAEDACDLIEVDYEPLPVVLDPNEARREGGPLVHEKMGTNVAYERTFSFGEVDKAFAEADRTVQAELYWPRSTGMPMDTNGAVADYDRGTGVLTIYGNSMNFTYFLWLYSITLKIPAAKLRLVPVAAGGSFGSKFFMHKVPCFTAFLAMTAGRPVKYIEDRVAHITNNDHCGSDRRYDAALAFDDDGTFRAVRISCVDDYGAYLQFGTGTHGNALSQIVGPYRIQHVEYSLAAILTNKNQQGAYRGFGAEVSNWVIERLVDLAARDLGLDRVDIRRRNLIAADQFPYRTPTGNIYDSGNYQGVLEKVLAAVDYD